MLKCLISFVFLATSSLIFAKTPDGDILGDESVCDQESGAAYGLCVAYCEAMDCDADELDLEDCPVPQQCIPGVEVQVCSGECVPEEEFSGGAGVGVCDQRFNCEKFLFDGGDCASP